MNHSKQFSALGDPTRLHILEFLRSGEKCVCEILPAINKPQNLVSHHLKILSEAGFLSARREGRNIYYALNTDQFTEIQQFFNLFQS